MSKKQKPKTTKKIQAVKDLQLMTVSTKVENKAPFSKRHLEKVVNQLIIEMNLVGKLSSSDVLANIPYAYTVDEVKKVINKIK